MLKVISIKFANMANDINTKVKYTKLLTNFGNITPNDFLI